MHMPGTHASPQDSRVNRTLSPSPSAEGHRSKTTLTIQPAGSALIIISTFIAGASEAETHVSCTFFSHPFCFEVGYHWLQPPVQLG